MMHIRSHFEIARELVDPQIPLLLLRPVTTDAVLLQEGVTRLRSEDSTGKGKASSKCDGE